MRLSENAFLIELGRMYERQKSTGKGSVWVTIKSTNGKPRKSKQQHDLPYKTIVRAVSGIKAKKEKKDIAVLLEASQVPKFQSSMLILMKAHMMDGLKKKDKKALVK